jgi:hypothetical protein
VALGRFTGSVIVGLGLPNLKMCPTQASDTDEFINFAEIIYRNLLFPLKLGV